MSFDQFSPLHPKYVLDVALPRLQGQLIMREFLPEKAVENLIYEWFYYGRVGGMTPEIEENAEPPSTNLEYESVTDRVKWYGEMDFISDYVNKSYKLLRNVVVDKTNYIADRLAMRHEYEILNAILNSDSADYPTPASNIVDLSTDDKQWIGGTDVTIIDDMIDAIEVVKRVGKVIPDTMIVGTKIAAQLIKETEIRQYQLAGPLMQVILKQGTLPQGSPNTAVIGNLLNLDVYVSNVDKLTDQIQEGKYVSAGDTAQYTPLLENEILIFKKGAELGRLHVSVPETPLSYPDPQLVRKRHIIAILKAMKPNIYRPKWIFKFTNAIV